MCFSEPVSWATLAACWAGCAALAATGRPHLVATAAFLAVVGGMQFWEALLWREVRRRPPGAGVGAGGGCSETNVALGRAAMLNNHTEPLVLAAACAAALGPPRSALAGAAAAGLLGAYAAAIAGVTVAAWRRRGCTTAGPDANGRVGLRWPWIVPNSTPLYALFVGSLVATSLAFFPPRFGAWAAAAIVATFGASWALYSGDPRTIGSMWCFFGAFLPWGALALG